MHSFFAKKVLPHFMCLRVGGGEGEGTFISFPIFMTFYAKLLSLCFQSHTLWFSDFPNCFKPELQNHIAKNIKTGDKFVTNF